ncbi:MAG: TM0996/MTH895 family glutaredoxin-like protein [Lunatimonas sp.]|uniref:thioredoxin family protein n=1 Tax=Lunatimonas sp. TaxID=2060141 RepID=UPI00263B4A53|nr:thioredoxin family protein [Lunatimonas sp.]MCC5936162.1 TM0996/MTH895 family glutaredoxin-like protein [Lunatimonas sp.]
MKTIKILGTGCAKCKQTEAAVREVIEKEGIAADVIKVEDIQQIMAYNILSTPAVVVDEVVKIKGKVPSAQEIMAALA